MKKQISFKIVLTALFMFAVSVLTVNAQTNITYNAPWHYITSPHGQIYIGPANQHGAHIYTGMPRFYFNKPIHALTGEFSAYQQTDLQLQTQGTRRMTILASNGNVGIGTASPVEKLHINGAIRGNQASGALRISTEHGFVDVGAKNGSFSHFYTNLPRFYFNKEVRVNGPIGSHSVDLNLQTHGNTRMTILASNGNVGIGTTAPTAKLDVNGRASCNTSFTLGQHSDDYRGLVVDNAGSHAWRLMELKNVNGTHMIVKGNGNVGIGTDSPENALDVVGTIRAEECLIETGWADYVLHDDYQLTTLEEEEKHIEENGHLMGFESEQEMGGEISVGDVSVRQQVKIEEMMLHLIEMDKNMKAMESKISNLEQENADLKKQISK